MPYLQSDQNGGMDRMLSSFARDAFQETNALYGELASGSRLGKPAIWFNYVFKRDLKPANIDSLTFEVTAVDRIALRQITKSAVESFEQKQKRNTKLKARLNEHCKRLKRIKNLTVAPHEAKFEGHEVASSVGNDAPNLPWRRIPFIVSRV